MALEGDASMRMKKGLLHSEFFDLEYVVNLCKKEINTENKM